VGRIKQLKEHKQHGSFLFHFSIYENSEKYPDAKLHWHDEYEIMYGIKGSVELRVGDSVFTMDKGDIAFIPCGIPHSLNSFGNQFLYQAIVFDPDMLGSSFVDSVKIDYIDPIKEKRINFIPVIKGNNDWEKKIIADTENMLSYYEKKPFGYELGIKGALCDIFFELLSNHPLVQQPNRKKKQDLERLKNTIFYIQNNYAQKMTVKELAAQCFMSEYYFCRYFKKHTGMSPIDYLNYYRIQEAKRLLKETAKPISNIAFDVGFNDSSYFAKIFMKYQKCTPSQFRVN
jgi:AraC-like DNA-binding protein/mannose-6-phosphate isomerase-like protein (cupin superfamily)